MRSIFLRPNSPRGRIEFVAKSMPNVAYDTAYVVAHTVGADRDAIVFARRSDGPLPVEVFAADKPHPNEALIGWVAQQLAAGQRAVRKQQSTQEQYNGLVFTLEAKLPQIAAWVEHTKPNLSAVSVGAAIAAAADFNSPESTAPVPQGEVIYRLSNGWTLQNLTTPEQIFAEGEAVQNCLRQTASGPSYAKKVKKGTTQIMSLRSPEGRPAVSIEYLPKRNRFVQIYAKQNTSLGATLQSLSETPDGEALWQGIQKYKPMMREIIMNKFGGNIQGLILADLPLPEGIKKIDRIDFFDYTSRLPDSVEHIGDVFGFDYYKYPLPASLKRIEMLFLSSDHPYELPPKLKQIRVLALSDYPFPVRDVSVDRLVVKPEYEFPIDGIKEVKSSLFFSKSNDVKTPKAKYKWPIPDHFDLTKIKHLGLGGYRFPLPKNLKSFNGILNLDNYDVDLPPGLRSVYALHLGNYLRDLPTALKTVKTNLDLIGFRREFPATIKKAGLVTTVLADDDDECPYPFEVPDGFYTNADEVRASQTYWPALAKEARRRKRGSRRSSGRGGAMSVPTEVDTTLPESLRALQSIQLNQPIPEGTTTIGFSDEEIAREKRKIKAEWELSDRIPRISLVGYNHPLPNTLTTVNADLSLYGYRFPLPDSLDNVAGELKVVCYDHPLPPRLRAGSADFAEYAHQIPLAIALFSDIRLQLGSPRLPSHLKEMAGSLLLFGYTHDLPVTLERIGGNLSILTYSNRLPPGLKSVGGNLRLSDASPPLPDSFEAVGGSISCFEYPHAFPSSLKFVGGKISLEGYKQPLPPGLLPAGGYEGTRGYPHDIPGQRPKRRAEAVQPNYGRMLARTSRPSKTKSSRGTRTSKKLVRKTSRSR